MKSIDTVYKGYRFRSRLEARWAVFMDTLGVKWEYEKEGFDLGALGRYLPDFWLPELNCFLEVKGADPTPGEIALCDLLRQQHGAAVVIVHGEIGAGPWQCFAHDMGHSSFGSSEWEVYWFVCECGKTKISWGDGCRAPTNGETFDRLPHWCGWNESYKADKCGPRFPSYLAISSTDHAVRRARSARFEYGQTPKV